MSKTKQIPEALPQFMDAPTLVVVSGSASARIFYALNGIIREIDEPRSDFVFDEREGFFLSRHPTVGTMGAGGPDMQNNAKERDRFLRRLADEISKLVRSEGIVAVRVLAEQASARRLLNALPSDIRAKAHLDAERNLQHKDPISIIHHLAG